MKCLQLVASMHWQFYQFYIKYLSRGSLYEPSQIYNAVCAIVFVLKISVLLICLTNL
jgi:hypothetical protein